MKRWFTIREIANARLPGLPTNPSALARRAARENWVTAKQAGKALRRRRKGSGGGWEYHLTVLPVAAQRALEGRETAAAAWRKSLRLRIGRFVLRVEITKPEAGARR